jgi:hypothetical protein
MELTAKQISKFEQKVLALLFEHKSHCSDEKKKLDQLDVQLFEEVVRDLWDLTGDFFQIGQKNSLWDHDGRGARHCGVIAVALSFNTRAH